jgi:carboxypeptidase D
VVVSCRFTASANLHEGAVVANYPFDGFTDHSNRVNNTRNPSPDDATFVHLAKVYARAHKTMAILKVRGGGGV